MSLDLDLIEEHWKDFGYRSDAVGQASGVIEALIAELRASRGVVEAARGVHARFGGVKVNGSLGDPWMNALDGALREYDRSLLNVKGSSE